MVNGNEVIDGDIKIKHGFGEVGTQLFRFDLGTFDSLLVHFGFVLANCRPNVKDEIFVLA